METQMMGTIGISYMPAIEAAKQFAISLQQVNAQMENTQKIAQRTGAVFSQDLAGGIQRAKVIYDQYGNVLKTVAAETKKVEAAALSSAKTVEETARRQSVLASQLQHRYGWFISGAMFYGAQNIARDIVSAASDVEHGMTRIRKVLNDQTADFQALRDELLDLGIQYGHTAQNVLEAATIWAQAGYRANEVTELTRTSLLAMNVAELTANESARLLIATMKQFNMTAEESKMIIDAVNEASNNYAVEAKDLMEAIAVSGQMAKNAGFELQQLVGYATALSEATGRSGKEIGNAIRSIIAFSQRPTAIDTFREIGVDVMDTAGNFREFDKVFMELSNKWNNVTEDQIEVFHELGKELGLVAEGIGNLTDVEKRDIAQAGANLFRRNYFISLMEHMVTAVEATTTAYDSLNSAEEENAMLMESHRKKVEQTKAAFQELAVTVGDMGYLDFLKGVADGTRNMLDVFQEMPGAIQGATIGMGSWVSMLAMLNLGTRTFVGLNLAQAITQVTTALRGLSIAGGLASLGVGGGLLVGGAAIAAIVGAIGSYTRAQQHAAEMDEKRRQQLGQLIKQYDTLEQSVENNRDNADKFIEANEKLTATMQEIGRIAPELVTAWDKHGNAVAIATERYQGLQRQAQLTKQELEGIQKFVAMTDVHLAEHSLQTAQTDYLRTLAEVSSARNRAMASGLMPPSGELPYWDNKLAEAEGLYKAAQREFEVAKAREKALNEAFSAVDKPFEPYVKEEKEKKSKELTPYQRALAEFEYMVAMDLLTIEQQIAQLRQFYNEYELTLEERRNLDIRIHRLTKQLNEEQVKAREDSLKKIADETQKHYEDAYRSALDYFNHEVALARMSRDEQIRYLSELSQAYEWETAKQWDIQERLFRLYQDELRKQQDSIEAAYRRRIELIEEEANKQIELIQQQIDDLDEDAKEEDRLRAQEEFEKRIEDLKEQYRYHDLRTGKEHEKAKIEIEQQIAEENRRWQQQLSDWEREDRRQSLQDQIKDIREQAEEEKRVWQQKYEDIKKRWDEWSEDFVSAAINDPKWLETGKSIGEQIAEGFSEGIREMDRLMDQVSQQADEARGTIPQPTMPSAAGDYIPPSARSVLNEILYLKDQWEKGQQEGNVGLQKWAVEQAKQYYAMLPDELRKKVEAMNNEQLRRYLDKAHTGAYVLESGAAELLKGERVLSPELTVAFDRLANALLRNPQTITESRSNVFKAPLFNAENVYFEDVQDMEILGRELGREVRKIR